MAELSSCELASLLYQSLNISLNTLQLVAAVTEMSAQEVAALVEKVAQLEAQLAQAQA